MPSACATPQTIHPRIEPLLPPFREFAADRIRTAGRLYVGEIAEWVAANARDQSGRSQSLSPAACRERARLLVKAMPELVRRAPRDGYSMLGLVQPRQTLATLLDRAGECVRPDYKAPQGRRGSRDVTVLSQSQMSKIRVAAGLLAEMLVGNRNMLAKVGEEHFGWTETGTLGEPGDWSILPRLAQYSDDTARTRADAKAGHGSAPAPWDPSTNTDRRKLHVQGIRLLLDLAATRGWILRTSDRPAAPTVPAPEWDPAVRDWLGRLSPSVPKGSREALRFGLRTLALYATALGHVDPSVTDWDTVRDRIEADWTSKRLGSSRNRYDMTRRAFKGLISAGLIKATPWPTSRDHRTVLVPCRAIEESAESLDFGGWRMTDGTIPAALLDSIYGVTAWARWVTLPYSKVIAEGLPERKLVHPTGREAMRAARRPDRFRQRPTTLFKSLEGVAYHAGYLARERGLDWTTVGLEELVRPDHLRDHFNSRHPKPDDTDSHLAAIASTLASIARPFLEAVAERDREVARVAGDHARATQREEDAKRFARWAAELQILAIEMDPGFGGRRSGDGDDHAATRQKAQQIWEEWTKDGVSGWEKLGKLHTLLVAAAEHAGARAAGNRGQRGRLSIREQVEMVEEDAGHPGGPRRFRPTLAWARCVRDAVLLGLLIRVPLRPRNVRTLTLTEWRNSLPGSKQPPHKWEGEILLDIPARKMKSGRAFRPAYLLLKDLADADILASARPDLLRLYFMPGGAREELLRLPRGLEELELPPDTIVESPYVFPAEARRSNSRDSQYVERVREGLMWPDGSLRQRFSMILERHASDLGLDVDRLREISGGLGPHSVRHLFGSHHCSGAEGAIGSLEAAKMLHHKNSTVTEAFYNGRAASQISVGGTAAQANAALAPAAAPAPTVARVRAELTEMVATLKSGQVDQATLLRQIADILAAVAPESAGDAV